MINKKFRVMPGTRMIQEKKRILLRHHRMPGDIITMTPLVRDIKKTYGDMVELYCLTPQGQDVWKYNPYVEQFDVDSMVLHDGKIGFLSREGNKLFQQKEIVIDEIYDLDYDIAAENQGRGLNMAEGFRQDFMGKSRYHIIPSTMWPDIYLTRKELDDFVDKNNYVFERGPFWVICPGNKQSCQVKIWPRSRWYDLVQSNPKVSFVQIGQSKHGHEWIKEDNVVNFIDQTTLRELFVLIYLSSGTIGYISLHMHIAAAFKRPSIVIGGGRELPSFYRYPNHVTCFSVGIHGCCQYGGCFKGKMKSVPECCGDNWYRTYAEEEIPNCMDFPVKPISLTLNHIIKKYEAGEMDKGRTDCLIDNIKPVLTRSSSKYSVIYNDEKVGIATDLEVTGPDDEEMISDQDKMEDKSMGRIKVELSNNDDERDPIEVIQKPLFRMICNATCFGGGERTALRLMRLMNEKGYNIEFIPTTGHVCMSAEFSKQILEIGWIKDIGQYAEPEIADVSFFQANDTLLRYYKSSHDDWAARWFKAAKRKIVGVNYTVWGLGKEEYRPDMVICQSEKLKNDYLSLFQIVVSPNNPFLNIVVVLKPPADLEEFYNYDYGLRDYNIIRLVRHSSQGDQKYSDDTYRHIRKILEIRKDIDISLMPGPSYINYNKVDGVTVYEENHWEVPEFLTIGNVFWYWVPEEKFIEAGCNAVLEAMAAGLPVLCNKNGGLVDIMTDWRRQKKYAYDSPYGWLCETEEQMYEAIKNMTIEEIGRKGYDAKVRAEELTDPKPWLDVIIGK